MGLPGTAFPCSTQVSLRLGAFEDDGKDLLAPSWEPLPSQCLRAITGLGIGVGPQREWGLCGLGKAITGTHVGEGSANVLTQLGLLEVRRQKHWMAGLPSSTAACELSDYGVRVTSLSLGVFITGGSFLTLQRPVGREGHTHALGLGW